MARKRDALRRIKQAATAVGTSRAELLDSILEAHRLGCTHEEIAKAAGVTRQRIGQILRGDP